MLNESTRILEVLAGSRAYGTNSPESDIDIRGVVIPPKDYFLGLLRFEQSQTINETDDKVYYDIRQFVKLLLENNPNIFEILFVIPEHVLFVNEYGQMLIDNKDMFLSQRSYKAFHGYAEAQFHRMENHHRWMINPPSEPSQSDFRGFFDKESGAYRFKSTNDKSAYDNARRHYNNYIEWRTNRNPERAKLEEKFGYDTKHAMHVMRLVNMGTEVLADSKVNVFRLDREFLLRIRNGEFSYEQFIDLMNAGMQNLDEAFFNTVLPVKPNFDKANQLCIDIVERFLHEQKV